MSADATRRTTEGEAMEVVAREGGPETAGLLADIFAYNARSLEWTFEQLFLGEQRAHGETKRRLAEANRRLSRVERRVLWLLGEDFEEDAP